MAVLTINQYPEPILLQKSETVTKDQLKSNGFQVFLNDLMDTLESYTPLGAGLSANQVGKLYRVLAINLEIGDEQFLKQFFINPRITKQSKKCELDWEGCLSFNGPEDTPDQWGLVSRPKEITVTALNREGQEFQVKARDFYARLILHEIDHLNGEVFVNKLESEIVNTEQLEEILKEESLETTPVG